jgi:uncharacterized membrane protein
MGVDASTAEQVPRLAAEGFRNLLSLGIATGGTILVCAGYAVVVPVRFTLDSVALTTLVFWIWYSLSVLVLTHKTFGSADHSTLREWFVATTPAARRLPTLNVQWSVLATIAVGVVFVLPGLLDSPLANALSFVVVVSAWLVTVSSYAVHYARLNSLEKSVDLPGTADGPVFLDYYYLAAQVATTFSSSDIAILTTHARAVVIGQTYISFAFSTFIIALLITMLFLP